MTRSNPTAPHKPKLTVTTTWRKVAVVIVLGIVLALAATGAAAELYKHNLQSRVDTIASALDTARVDRLKHTPLRQDSVDYDYLRTKLAAVKQANGDTRSVYLLARNDQGQVYYLADSSPENPAGYSTRGQTLPAASPALKQMFDANTGLIEGPARDGRGTQLSALAPIINDQNYGFVGVVGIDVAASSYSLLLGLAGALPISLALVMAAVILVADHTRRRRLENLRFRAELAAAVSHELSAPLAGLRWAVDDLLQQKLPPKLENAMQALSDSTGQLQAGAEDIMQLSSSDAGHARQLTLHEYNLRAVLDGVVSAQTLAAARRNITLQYTTGWPEKVMVLADEPRLRRALNILVSNAITHGKPHSAVRLGYELRKTGGRHVVSIQDHGAGIPLHEQGRLLRAPRLSGENLPAGAGLYMARQIVEQHGGNVHLKSTEGKGTTVSVELPKLSNGNKH